MRAETLPFVGTEEMVGPEPGTRPLGRRLPSAEDLALAVAFGALAVLPPLEIFLRAVFSTGISNSAGLVQHLTLVGGMLGAAVAARHGRLLSLAAAPALLKDPWKGRIQVVTGGLGAAVAAFFFAAGLRFVASERAAGGVLAYGFPLWVPQLALPAGFAAVGWWLLRRGDGSGRRQGWAAAIAAAAVLAPILAPVPPGGLVVPALVVVIGAAALGLPIFAALGGVALVLFWGAEIPIPSLTVEHYRIVTNPTLPSIPLFTLAGYLLAEGGASRRLVRVFRALFGWFRGGPAVATVLACAFFTSFTGASGVTILALGGLLLPTLKTAGYSERDSLGLVAGAGSLGLLFPPCLPLILYAIVAGVTVEEMFLGGIGPGILLVGLVAWWGVRRGARGGTFRSPFRREEALEALWEAKWELLVPVVALASLFSGLCTPVESAAVTALYALVVETALYRDLKATDLPRVVAECGVVIGGVLLILGMALGFSNYLIDAQVADKAAEWATEAIRSKWLFLILLNLFLLAVGCLMDIYSAIVVVVPLLLPVGAAFGIHPVHLGIIFLANLELGYLTPPVGMNLFLASYRFGKPMGEVIRSVLPIALLILLGVLVITYFPPLATALPGWRG